MKYPLDLHNLLDSDGAQLGWLLLFSVTLKKRVGAWNSFFCVLGSLSIRPAKGLTVVSDEWDNRHSLRMETHLSWPLLAWYSHPCPLALRVNISFNPTADTLNCGSWSQSLLGGLDIMSTYAHWFW